MKWFKIKDYTKDLNPSKRYVIYHAQIERVYEDYQLITFDKDSKSWMNLEGILDHRDMIYFQYFCEIEHPALFIQPERLSEKTPEKVMR